MQRPRFRQPIPRRRITLQPTICAAIHLILPLQARNQHHRFASVVFVDGVHGAACVDALLQCVREDAGDVVVRNVFADGGGVELAVPVSEAAGVCLVEHGDLSGVGRLDERG
jgi:hypothetical protein